MAPYLRLSGKGEIKTAQERDLHPDNNAGMSLLPQLMARDADDFLKMARFIQNMGYDEVNWNLGCPYPMVAKRGLGSGLLKAPERIDAILRKVLEESDIKVSVKMRLGYEDPREILRVLPVLNKHPLHYVCIHPRTGKQLYGGKADLDAFEEASSLCQHPLFYNGDIHSVKAFEEIYDRFPHLNNYMLGRGMISDPFLPAMIRAGSQVYPADAARTFERFHEDLFNSIAQTLSGPKHIHQRMYQYWEYFIRLFPGAPKGLKKIRKALDLDAYLREASHIISTGPAHP